MSKVFKIVLISVATIGTQTITLNHTCEAIETSENQYKQNLQQWFKTFKDALNLSDTTKKNEALKKFFSEDFATSKISISLVGIDSQKIKEALAKRLISLYTTKTITDIVTKSSINEKSISTTKKAKSTTISANIDNKTEKTSSKLTVVVDNETGLILDINVEGVAIISGIKSQIQTIGGKSIREMPPAERETEVSKVLAG